MTSELICATGIEFVDAIAQRRHHQLDVQNAPSRKFYGMQDHTEGTWMLISCETYHRDEEKILAVAAFRGIPLPVSRMLRR